MNHEPSKRAYASDAFISTTVSRISHPVVSFTSNDFSAQELLIVAQVDYNSLTNRLHLFEPLTTTAILNVFDIIFNLRLALLAVVARTLSCTTTWSRPPVKVTRAMTCDTTWSTSPRTPAAVQAGGCSSGMRHAARAYICPCLSLLS